MNLRKLKKTAEYDGNQIQVIHVRSSEPDLQQIEYWKTGPKRHAVRPVGWKDILGSIIEFQGAFLLPDEPDDVQYPSVQEGIHALVKQQENRCKQQRGEGMEFLFAGESKSSLFRIASKSVNEAQYKVIRRR